jgi:hypothetical protein
MLSSSKVNHGRLEIVRLCMMFESFHIAERVLAVGMMDMQDIDLYLWLRDTSTNTQVTAHGSTS